MKHHCTRAVNQQCSQIRIASLTDPQQLLFAATEGLPWDQPQPRSELSAVLERPRISNARHQRARRQRTDARDRLESPARFALSMPHLDLMLELSHVLA